MAALRDRQGASVGYYDNEIEDRQESGMSAWDLTERIVVLFVRLLGVAILVVGLWTAVVVLLEAWHLYQDPGRVDRFVVAVEQGSNLDRAVATQFSRLDEEAGEATGTAPAAEDGIRLSYFVAWFIVLALLLVLGVLATSAITAGARLALPRGTAGPLGSRPAREREARRPVLKNLVDD